MTNSNVKEVRSIAILSHGAAGKTSLADAMLYAAAGRLGKMSHFAQQNSKDVGL